MCMKSLLFNDQPLCDFYIILMFAKLDSLLQHLNAQQFQEY